MRYLLFILATITILQSSCKSKDSYGYTCTCKDKNGKLADTSYVINSGASGEAIYNCQRFADTANKYGRAYSCAIK